MPELRWILLGLGTLFFIGLWWWEARRGRQAADSTASLNPVDSFTSTSTTVVRDVARADEDEHAMRDLTPWNEPAPEESPPWDETDDDSPEEDTRAAPAAFEPPADHDDEPQTMIDIAALPRPVRNSPPMRIEPVIGDFAGAVGARPGSQAAQSGSAQQSSPPATPADTQTPASGAARELAAAPVEEKIVTLRVSAPPLERFEGSRLVAALQAAGLEHGKFSIFHRLAADGSTLFSVASLVEPGTFDLDAIEGRRFPGVSLFAVLRSDADPAAVLDEMLSTARGLASNLRGNVQDERGAPLSPQRLADLRAGIAAWTRRTA